MSMIFIKSAKFTYEFTTEFSNKFEAIYNFLANELKHGNFLLIYAGKVIYKDQIIENVFQNHDYYLSLATVKNYEDYEKKNRKCK
jgi:hypothetical protein